MRSAAEATASALHWETLAAECDRMADWEESQLRWGARREPTQGQELSRRRGCLPYGSRDRHTTLRVLPEA